MKKYFSGGSVQMTSTWQCVEKNIENEPVVYGQNYAFKNGEPTIGKATATISYSFASGVKINSATVYASVGSPESGIAVLTMNGGTFSRSRAVKLSGTSGVYTCGFTFKANGSRNDTAYHESVLSITQITLEVDYDENANEEQKELNEQNTDIKTGKESSGFRIPPQTVCIYDQDTGDIYTFDGVVKIQEAMTLKIEEDPSKKKELYVNNARNEPDKVTLDVMMSDVYSGMSTITRATSSSTQQQAAISSFLDGGGRTRSGNAAAVLHELKEARNLLSVLTPQYVFTDMLLQSVTINQDDSCPFGWSGQLVFQEKYEETKKDDNTSSVATNSNVDTRTPSVLVDWIGADAVPSGG